MIVQSLEAIYAEHPSPRSSFVSLPRRYGGRRYQVRAVFVVIDDIGLLPVAQDAAEGLDRLFAAAYKKRSVAVSSSLHPVAFDELMPKTLATVEPAPAPRPRLSDHRRQRPPLPSPHRPRGETVDLTNGR